MATSVRPKQLLPLLIDQVRRRKEAFIHRLEQRIQMGGIPDGYTTPCRFYNGASYHGYPNLTFHLPGSNGDKYVVHAHRLFWVLANCQEIPKGMEPDHTCQNRACIAHLNLVPMAENRAARYKRGYCAKCKRFGCKHAAKND